MPTPKETIEVLNDLIKINNHWIAGYEYALKELKIAEADLKELFQTINDNEGHQSHSGQINGFTPLNNKKLHPSVGTMMLKTWVYLITLVSLHGRNLLSKAARKVYKKAVASENLPANLKEMVENQKFILKSSQDDIKASRARDINSAVVEN